MSGIDTEFTPVDDSVLQNLRPGSFLQLKVYPTNEQGQFLTPIVSEVRVKEVHPSERFGYVAVLVDKSGKEYSVPSGRAAVKMLVEASPIGAS